MPNAPKFVIGFEPTQAIEYLKQRRLLVGKIKKKKIYDSALARAVTISKMTNLDITQDIYASLERALKEGKSLANWKKELVGELERKGWIAGHDKRISKGIDGKLIANPQDGEYFGTPRRLNTIYRVNTQQAYSAARYQRYMDNVDNRPYWQYSAVGDQRTRPAHLALNGRVYRYDDPFWSTFYPPNGFNCRCTVIALGERDLTRKGLEVGSSEGKLVKAKRPKDKQGNQETTTGFVLPDGRILATDKGFDYNVGRLTYKPNLDLYAESLAHQFAKSEMSGAEFKLGYERFEKAYFAEKAKLGFEKMQKIDDKQELILVQNLTSVNFHFAAGRLSDADTALLNTEVSTVWLSDQTLVKQFNSRLGDPNFDFESYQNVPDTIFSADNIYKTNDERVILIKKINGQIFEVVFKYLSNTKENFLLSARWANEKNLRSEIKRYEIVR